MMIDNIIIQKIKTDHKWPYPEEVENKYLYARNINHVNTLYIY